MAPYNTTQFIMEDLEARNLEPDVTALVEKLNVRSSLGCNFDSLDFGPPLTSVSRPSNLIKVVLDRTGAGAESVRTAGRGRSTARAAPPPPPPTTTRGPPSTSTPSSTSSTTPSTSSASSPSPRYAPCPVPVPYLSLNPLPSFQSELIQEVISLEADVSRSGVEAKELRQMVARLRADNYGLRKTLREAGLPEARPTSAPPPPPAPATPPSTNAEPAPTDPDHDTGTDTTASDQHNALS